MGKLEIKYSGTQIKKPSPTNLAGATIDPYYSSVAGSGISKLGSYVDGIIKKTRVQNDKNRIRKLKIDVDKHLITEYSKYATSSDTADVNTFLENTDKSKIKNILKKENKYVRNGLEAYLLDQQRDLHFKLTGEITQRHVKETELGDHIDLDKLTIDMASNDVVTRTKAYAAFNSWFKDPTNSMRYGAVKLKKLYDDKLSQAKRYQLEFEIKNDPLAILRNPKKITSLDNQLEANTLFKTAQANAVNFVEQRDWDDLQLVEASIQEKLNNFAEIITRMNTWKGNEKDWRASIPSIDDLHDMFKLDQINSTQYAVLLDFYSNPRKVSDQSVVEMINAQISLAEGTEDIDNLDKMVSLDIGTASKLGIKDISKYKKQFDLAKKNFPAFQEAKSFEEKLEINMGKINSVGTNPFAKNKAQSQEEKLLEKAAVDYYKDLVYEKNVLASDAYVQTIERFTTDKTLPTIYNVATLSSIKLKVPKANELDAKKYFTDARNEIAQAYKDKRIDLQVYMEDLAAMDVIEDVFDVRMDVFAHKDNTLNFAFSNKMGRPIPEIKKEGS